MGVDWYACGICGETFPDCGDYGWCTECETRLCSRCRDKQVDKYGNPPSGSEKESWYGSYSADRCDLCSGKIIYDKDIVEYFLNKYDITRDEVVNIIQREKSK